MIALILVLVALTFGAVSLWSGAIFDLCLFSPTNVREDSFRKDCTEIESRTGESSFQIGEILFVSGSVAE